MSKTLVAYFSATGTTGRLAEAIAAELGADLVEIAPAVPYAAADLDWTDKTSRSTVEMADPASRVELAEEPGDLAPYDTVLVGYPIWWYTAPHVVSTWVEKADLAGKKVVTWATSGGSGMCTSTADLAALAPGAEWVDGEVLRDEAAARSWAAGL